MTTTARPFQTMTQDVIAAMLARLERGERDVLPAGPYRKTLQRLVDAGGFAMTTQLVPAGTHHERTTSRLNWLATHGLAGMVRLELTRGVFWYVTLQGLDALGLEAPELLAAVREQLATVVVRPRAPEPALPHWHGPACPRCRGPLLHDREDFPDRMCFTCGFVAYHRRVRKGISTWNQD